jgi:hypothetical protein
MTRLSCVVPAVISRWKQKNARRLRIVLWIFATCVPGAAWKRSAPLQTKRTEIEQATSAHLPELRAQAWSMRAKIKQQRQGFTEIFEVGWVAFAGNSRAKGEAHFERFKYGRPQGAHTPPPGPALALSGSPGGQRLTYHRTKRRSRPS